MPTYVPSSVTLAAAVAAKFANNTLLGVVGGVSNVNAENRLPTTLATVDETDSEEETPTRDLPRTALSEVHSDASPTVRPTRDVPL